MGRTRLEGEGRPAAVRPGPAAPSTWSYYDTTGAQQTIDLPAKSLGFTYCQVPIIYKLGDPGIIVTRGDGSRDRVSGGSLDHETSDALFRRLGTVARVEVSLDQSLLVGLNDSDQSAT